MKFRFAAIDGTGRVLRGVLRAEGEEDARELLLSGDVYAKTLEPADEEEKATWAPRARIMSRHASAGAAAAELRPVAGLFPTRCVAGHGAGSAGEAGFAESGEFVYTQRGGGKPLVVSPGEIEVAALAGFPRRLLRLTLLDGRMIEFDAGFLFASGGARGAVRRLRSTPGKKA